MANNVGIPVAPAGGQTIITEDIPAASGLQMARTKLVTGAINVDGGDVSATNPLFVQVAVGTAAIGTVGVTALPALQIFNGTTLDSARSLSAVGDGLGVELSTQPASTAPAAAVPVANTAAVTTFAAVAGQQHRLTFLAISYSAAPTGGLLTVADGATNLINIDIAAAGPFLIPMPPGGIKGSINTAMTITLAPAGAAVIGKVSAAKLTA